MPRTDRMPWSMALILVLTHAVATARNERKPPPPVLISSGGLPGDGVDVWTPDDPGGGGGSGGGGCGGGGGGSNHNLCNYGFPPDGPPIGGGGHSTSGDGGWDWWNSGGFWGWGSGWWRYPDPQWPSDGGGNSGGEGEGSAGSIGCGLDPDRAANSGCRIIVTGGDDNVCGCILKVKRNSKGDLVWLDDCAICVYDPDYASPDCAGKHQGDECPGYH